MRLRYRRERELVSFGRPGTSNNVRTNSSSFQLHYENSQGDEVTPSSPRIFRGTRYVSKGFRPFNSRSL